MKFPLVIRHRRIEAKIYGKTAKYPFYRLAYYSGGKRHVRSFATYAKAKAAGDKKVRELAQGSDADVLTPAQTRDALAAYQRLEAHRIATGKQFSLLGAVSEFCESDAKLDGHTLSEAVAGFNRNAATVKRKLLGDAVNDFVLSRKPKTEAKEGKRAQLSKGYAYSVELWLNEFAEMIQNTAVCDLTKEHLAAYIATQSKFGPKTRNHKRATLKMFFKWCMRHDYLSATHRLFEAEAFVREQDDLTDTDFYRPAELQKLLDKAQETKSRLLPIIAIAGLSGLRIREVMRLTWDEVWNIPGHIEVKANKSKTRQRRLVEIPDSLGLWLAPFRNAKGLIWDDKPAAYYDEFAKFRTDHKLPDRHNGLRHGFITHHFALHANENLTAQQAGNTPNVVHKSYKGLATKADAEKWFAVKPNEAK